MQMGLGQDGIKHRYLLNISGLIHLKITLCSSILMVIMVWILTSLHLLSNFKKILESSQPMDANSSKRLSVQWMILEVHLSNSSTSNNKMLNNKKPNNNCSSNKKRTSIITQYRFKPSTSKNSSTKILVRQSKLVLLLNRTNKWCSIEPSAKINSIREKRFSEMKQNEL